MSPSTSRPRTQRLYDSSTTTPSPLAVKGVAESRRQRIASRARAHAPALGLDNSTLGTGPVAMLWGKQTIGSAPPPGGPLRGTPASSPSAVYGAQPAAAIRCAGT